MTTHPSQRNAQAWGRGIPADTGHGKGQLVRDTSGQRHVLSNLGAHELLVVDQQQLCPSVRQREGQRPADSARLHEATAQVCAGPKTRPAIADVVLETTQPCHRGRLEVPVRDQFRSAPRRAGQRNRQQASQQQSSTHSFTPMGTRSNSVVRTIDAVFPAPEGRTGRNTLRHSSLRRNECYARDGACDAHAATDTSFGAGGTERTLPHFRTHGHCRRPVSNMSASTVVNGPSTWAGAPEWG